MVKADLKQVRSVPGKKKIVGKKGGNVAGVKVGKGKTANVVRDANMKKLQQQANRIRKVVHFELFFVTGLTLIFSLRCASSAKGKSHGETWSATAGGCCYEKSCSGQTKDPTI